MTDQRPNDADTALDAHLARAWPALERARVGPFEARFGAGYGRRSNSARRVREDAAATTPTDAEITAVEAAYRARGMRPGFVVVPALGDGDLDARLRARGYVDSEPFDVWTALVTTVIRRAPASRVAVAIGRADALTIARTLGDVAPDKRADTARLAGLFAHAIETTWLAAAGPKAEDGAPVAAAVGVLDGAYGSVHELVASPASRRRGAGRSVVVALAEAFERAGATVVVAQVSSANEASKALFAGLGFERAYAYHYRMASGGDEATRV